jgi:peptidyl-prolyl cis-trans isomerase C
MRTLLLSLALISGCATHTTPGEIAATGDAVVTVNGNIITTDMVAAITDRMPPEEKARLEMDPSAFEGLKERMIMSELLYREALKSDLAADPKIQLAIAITQREVLAAAQLDKFMEESATEEAIQAYYSEHSVEFARPSIKAKHIMVTDEALAASIVEQVRSGASFSDLAREHSLDKTTSSNGGEIPDWLSKDMLPPQLATAFFAIEKDDVSDPIPVQGNFLVVGIMDKRDATPLDDVREDIKRSIGQEGIEGYLTSLKDLAAIVEGVNPYAPEAPTAEEAPAVEEAPPIEAAH